MIKMETNDNESNLTAVVICEGDYHDPLFSSKLENIVKKLNHLVEETKSNKLKVNKVSLTS